MELQLDELLTKAIREVKHRLRTLNGKRQFVPRNQVSPLLVALFIISTHKLVVSRNFLSIRIVLSCFYLLIFYFEKFSTWIWRLPFAVYVKLYYFSMFNLSIIDRLFQLTASKQT